MAARSRWAERGATRVVKKLSVVHKEGWRLLGEVGVDTGRLLIADPAYDVEDVETSLLDGELVEQCGPRGLALVFPSGYGDGLYPVYGRLNEDGRVVEVRILMDFAERNDPPV